MKIIIKKYITNILISLDQTGNALCGGDPDETFSSHIGKVKKALGGRIGWERPVLKILDFILDRIDRNHSVDAIEEDEGGDSLRSVDRPEKNSSVVEKDKAGHDLRPTDKPEKKTD